MSAREKAYWLTKANPYKQAYMWDAFREGARAWWAQDGSETYPYISNRERVAFWKGYMAAEKAWPR